jgi:hypothetical protein
MHWQLRCFETKTESTDIKHAVLNTLKSIKDLGDGTAVALDELDRVLGLGLDGFLYLGLKERFHQTRIDNGRGMAGANADDNFFGGGSGRNT